MINIGIITTPFLTEEYTKKELIDIETLPYLEKKCIKNLPDFLKFEDDDKTYLDSDALIINYLKCHNFHNININILNPIELTEEELESNDLNFILTFDLIEAFHTLPTKLFDRYKNLIENADNIYPNIEFQKFVNYKSDYYKFMKNNGINVMDFFVIYNNDDYEEKLEDFFQYKKYNNWDNYIIKPLYGQEGIGFSFFHKSTALCSVQSKVENLFENNYPGVILQREIKNIINCKKDCKSEYKSYFIGGEYLYMIEIEIGKDDKYILLNTYKDKPEQHVEKVIDFSKKVYNSLPKIIVNDIELNYLIIRVDLMYDNNNNLIVSEIEFVPSLFLEEIWENKKSRNELNIQKIIGDNMINITTDYVNKLKDRNKNKWITKKIIKYTVLIILTIIIITIVWRYFIKKNKKMI